MTSIAIKSLLTTSMSLTALAGALAFPQAALAQSTAVAEEADGAGTIVVTARKREEDILDVPLTVTALNAEALDARGVATMQDLVSSTPGLNINDSSSGHADRGFQQIVLRGFTPVTTNNTTTSLFIDGVPVSSPSAFTAISSPERIEILKGPQSAYFGRNTFAGAVNVVNKVPGNDFGGSLTAMIGSHANRRFRAEIEGPLIPDKIALRATFNHFEKDGSWHNGAPSGGTLGDQSSQSYSLTAVITPTEWLTIKGYGLHARDRDGAPANARVLAYNLTGPSGTVLQPSQSNCTFNGLLRGVRGAAGEATVVNNFICGTVPTLNVPVSANNVDDAITSAFLALPDNRLVSPSDGIDGYGLFRKYRHYHVTADAEITDSLTATFLAGWNREFWQTMIDLDGFDGSKLVVGTPGTPATSPRGFYDFPFLVEREVRDSSLEGRLRYESDALDVVVGVSHLKATTRAAQRGTTGVLTAALIQPPGGFSENKTTGFFFGATYDLTDALSFSAEGRYQIDKLATYAGATPITASTSLFIPAGTYAPFSLLAAATYKNFTPRLIVDYKINDDTLIYASWAKGVNPAQFNQNIISQTLVAQQAIAAAGVTIAIQPEKLDNYEIGIKGKMLNGAVRYSLSAYYAQWRNQINSASLILTNPANPLTPLLVAGFFNAGSVNLKGLDVELAWKASDLISFEFSGAINDTDVREYRNVTATQLTGIFDFSGKEMPFTSKYSFNTAVQLGQAIDGWDDGSWFFRTDWSYKSGAFTGIANTTKSKSRNLVNMRAGISKGGFSLEAFVTNVFNNTNPNSAIDQTLFDPAGIGIRANSAIFVNLPDKRTVGVQAGFKF